MRHASTGGARSFASTLPVLGTTARDESERAGGPEAVHCQARLPGEVSRHVYQAIPRGLLPAPDLRPVHISHPAITAEGKDKEGPTRPSQRIDTPLTQTVELRLALRKPLRVRRVDEEDDAVHFGEVVPPQAAGLHVPAEVVRREFDVTDGEFLGGWEVSGVRIGLTCFVAEQRGLDRRNMSGGRDTAGGGKVVSQTENPVCRN